MAELVESNVKVVNVAHPEVTITKFVVALAPTGDGGVHAVLDEWQREVLRVMMIPRYLISSGPRHGHRVHHLVGRSFDGLIVDDLAGERSP